MISTLLLLSHLLIFLGVNELEPGMKGIGLTVFKGTKVDTFQAEIVGVLKRALPRGDIILAEISGGPIDSAGFIAGMSGSPVYIDGKLIGAVAYGYGSFAKKFICGITPIDEMLNPPTLGYGNSLDIFPNLRIPVCFSNIDNRIINQMKDSLGVFRVLAVQGGASLPDSLLPTPGSVICAVLVRGDANLFAVGTCTYREGNKVWGFGHPFQSVGKTSLPMTAGYIYSVFPSSQYSFKIASTTEIIGAITNDGSRGIIGVIGNIPDMVDLDIYLKGDKYHYEIVKDERLFTNLVNSMIGNTIYTGLRIKGEMTITQDIDIDIENGPDLRLKDMVTGNINQIMKSIAQPIVLLYRNPFQKINIKNISIKLTPEDSLLVAEITNVYADKEEVKAGDTLRILLIMRPYKREFMKRVIEIPIPEQVSKGKLKLIIEGGGQVRKSREKELKSFTGLIDYLVSRPKLSDILITLKQAGETAYIRGEKFPLLPPTLSSLIKKSQDKKLTKESAIVEKRIDTDYVIKGRVELTLEVK